MANPHRGEAEFTVDGETYRLKFDWNAAAEFEEAAGRPISDALMDVVREKLSARSLRAMLWAGLQTHHKGISLATAGRFIDVLGRVETSRLMGRALRYYFPEIPLPAGEGEDPGNPRKGGGPPPASTT